MDSSMTQLEFEIESLVTLDQVIPSFGSFRRKPLKIVYEYVCLARRVAIALKAIENRALFSQIARQPTLFM